MKFEELALAESIKKALKEFGYLEATMIQEKAIPEIMKGRDIIGQSQTGTGKTAAYGLPILECCKSDTKKVQALILCPTRELALQVVGEIRKFAKYMEGIKSLAVYGGESIERQITALKGTQIVVGTPGRIMDHLRRKTLKFDYLQMVVLDEADEMLNMGFEEDIQTILAQTPEERQTILFSATMSERILKIAQKYLKNPYEIKIPSKELTVDKIEQIAIELKQSMKDEALARIIEQNDPKKCVVFCNTKRKVDDVYEALRKKGFKVESLHGDVKQDQRERIMKRFKNGDFQILIATDVVARGIDVEELELVMNYDVPQEEEYYVHRIGRTGRNGKTGKAYTFVVGRERQRLFQIEKYAKTRIVPGTIPTDEEMQEIKKRKIITRVQKRIDLANETDNAILAEIQKSLQENHSNDVLIKTLLNMVVGKELIITSLNTSLAKEKRAISSKNVSFHSEKGAKGKRHMESQSGYAHRQSRGKQGFKKGEFEKEYKTVEKNWKQTKRSYKPREKRKILQNTDMSK